MSIILGHELIHAYRNIRGEKRSDNVKNDYIDDNGKECTEIISAGEAMAVGIKSYTGIINKKYMLFNTWSVTENSIRYELEVNKRVAYTSVSIYD